MNDDMTLPFVSRLTIVHGLPINKNHHGCLPFQVVWPHERPPIACTAMSSESSSSSNELLEQVFNLIQSGNEHESSSQPWQAVASFAQAAGLLDQLARDAIRPQSSTDNNKEEEAGADDASRKIAALYASQSLEYTVRSRSILLQALHDEHERDKHTSGEVSDSPETSAAAASRQDCFVRSSLSEEELDRRIQLFATLFARPQPAPTRNAAAESAAPDADADAAATERSLQDRWMNLNQNLPKGFKTSDQRLADINRGLNRLGLSSVQYHSSDSGPSTTNRVNPYDVLGVPSSNNKSESEQVEDIIAQATDEVRLLQQQTGPLTTDVPGSSNIAALSNGGPTTSDSVSVGSDVDSSDPDDDDDDDDNDDDNEEAAVDELSPEQIASIGEHAATAQAELAQLFALLEKDEGGDAAIEFDPAAGRRHLRLAMSSLRKAKRAWTSSSSTRPGPAAAAAEDTA
jgi:hypothetical protein